MCIWVIPKYQNWVWLKIVIKFLILDAPQAVLNLGSSLNASNIKEGDDVYFECNVRANPKPYKITWKFNVSFNSNTTFLIKNGLYVQGNSRYKD